MPNVSDGDVLGQLAPPTAQTATAMLYFQCISLIRANAGATPRPERCSVNSGLAALGAENAMLLWLTALTPSAHLQAWRSPPGFHRPVTLCRGDLNNPSSPKFSTQSVFLQCTALLTVAFTKTVSSYTHPFNHSIELFTVKVKQVY